MDMVNSLVGATVEYSDMKKAEHRAGFEKILAQSKKRITKELELLYATSNKAIIVTTLAEMHSFYSRQSYALSIRSHINFKRNRAVVEEYLLEGADEREMRLLKLLKTYSKNPELREVLIKAIFYFVGVYKSRLHNFKPYLTKEEFIYVA